jgi:nicotinamide-nucleotide amidase
MKPSLTTQIKILAELLEAKGLRLATAESCTGGGIAEALTSVAGSSDWFECGFVSYSNESKQSMLGVSQESLARHGAVSEAVVKEMATGAVANSNAQVSVSVSGVAGPGGGTPEKPVGYVWIAWTQQAGKSSATCFHFQGDREQVRYQTIEAAIDGLIDLVRRL